MSLLDDLLQTTETGKIDSFDQKPSPTSPTSPPAEAPPRALATTQSRSATPEADRSARLDAERNERDRPVERGYDDGLPSVGSAEWTRSTVPDSRHPLIPPEVRAKLEAIEVEARSKGWPAELLWSSEFWDLPRGLAAVLDPDDEIVEVSAQCITILKYRRDIQRFRRHIA